MSSQKNQGSQTPQAQDQQKQDQKSANPNQQDHKQPQQAPNKKA